MVHWTGATDYPKSADDAVSELRNFTGPRFDVVNQERRPEYRVDLWRRLAGE
jgi:hypothetical protein